MFKNYLRIALRNISRQKLFSAVNILGLSIGMAVFMLIAEYAVSEYNTNRFHANFDRLYRANVVYKEGNNDYYLPAGYAPILQSKFAAIEQSVRVCDGIGGGVISINNDTVTTGNVDLSFREENIIYAEPTLFKVFSFALTAGNAILPANTLALSQSTASKLFGNQNPIGQRITVSNQFGNLPYTVASVYSDMPAGSAIQASVVLSIETLVNPANRNGNDWADPNGTEAGFAKIYLLLQKGADPQLLSRQVMDYIRSVNPDSATDQLVLQPFSALHLAPHFSYPLQTNGNLLLVTVLVAIAVLLLLIAWINYINLSTAQAVSRTKDVGVRKVLGASRTQLVAQYLTETLLLTAMSIVIAFVIVQLMQNTFNGFTGKTLSLAVLQQGWFIVTGVAFLLAGTLLAGGYVAFVVSGYNPVYSIRSKFEKLGSGLLLRKSLVVFQFTISIVFIIGTIVLYRQLQYMHTQNLGMSLNQLLVIKGPTVTTDGQAKKNIAFKNALAQLPFVKKSTASNNVPGQGYNFSANGITSQNPRAGDDRKSYSMFICDEQFFNTYGIQLAEGNAFTSKDATDGWGKAKRVIINQKAATEFGFAKDQPIVGKKIIWGDAYEIVGVVKDYHHLSLREAIKPVVYLPSTSFGYFTVQTDVMDLPAKLKVLQQQYKANFAGNPFEYFFADEQYDRQYAAEQKLGNVFIAATLVAVFIACMGLFALATLAAQQRTKEIGIRKVLGANVASIVTLVSRDFIRLVGVALIIASPLAWWASNLWLQDFAYKATVSWWIFLLAGGVALLVAFCTIGFQALKAAMANPVKSLRSE